MGCLRMRVYDYSVLYSNRNHLENREAIPDLHLWSAVFQLPFLGMVRHVDVSTVCSACLIKKTTRPPYPRPSIQGV